MGQNISTQIIDKPNHRISNGKKALFALLILVSFMMSLTSAPFARTQMAATGPMAKSNAKPQPTPPVEKPLDEDAAAALAGKLKEGLAAEIADQDALAAIDEKWKARSLAGKTRTEIMTLLFNDLKSVITEEETQNKIWTSWKEIRIEAEPDPAPANPPANPPVVPVRPGTKAQLRP